MEPLRLLDSLTDRERLLMAATWRAARPSDAPVDFHRRARPETLSADEDGSYTTVLGDPRYLHAALETASIATDLLAGSADERKVA